MLTAIGAFLVIVLVHGFYRVGWKAGFRATYRVQRRMVYKVEQAPSHVKVCAAMDISQEELRMRGPNMATFIERELLRKVLEQAKGLLTIEEKEWDDGRRYYRGKGKTIRATLRVIPPR